MNWDIYTKKIQFFEENTFSVSQLHNFIPKYLSMYVWPKIFNNCTLFANFASYFSGRVMFSCIIAQSDKLDYISKKFRWKMKWLTCSHSLNNFDTASFTHLNWGQRVWPIERVRTIVIYKAVAFKALHFVPWKNVWCDSWFKQPTIIKPYPNNLPWHLIHQNWKELWSGRWEDIVWNQILMFQFESWPTFFQFSRLFQIQFCSKHSICQVITLLLFLLFLYFCFAETAINFTSLLDLFNQCVSCSESMKGSFGEQLTHYFSSVVPTATEEREIDKQRQACNSLLLHCKRDSQRELGKGLYQIQYNQPYNTHKVSFSSRGEELLIEREPGDFQFQTSKYFFR